MKAIRSTCGDALHMAALGLVGASLGLWIKAQRSEGQGRSDANHQALFVGLWPPTLWLVGDTVERRERLIRKARMKGERCHHGRHDSKCGHRHE